MKRYKLQLLIILILSSSLYCENVGNGLGDSTSMSVIDVTANSVTYYTPEKTSFTLIKNPDLPGNATFPMSANDNTSEQVPINFMIADSEVDFQLYSEVINWANQSCNNYNIKKIGFSGGNNVSSDLSTNPDQPVTEIYWSDAVVWCNALTEYINSSNGSEPDMDCVFYADENYTIPIRNSAQYSIATPGSACKPYVKADTVSNTDMSKCTATGFRIPTSVEWEFAARYRGSDPTNAILFSTAYYTKGNSASGARLSTSDEEESALFAVFTPQFGDPYSTKSIKSKKPNAMGLYDMSGNVSEWCYDEIPSGSPVAHVLRGGNWKSVALYSAIGYVDSKNSDISDSTCGFRIAKNIR